MTMEWHHSNEFNSNRGNSFPEHSERMSGFRRSHAVVAMVNAPRRDEAALLESTRPLPVGHPVMKTGGSRFFNSPADWSALVPVLKVARHKLSQN